MALIIFRGNLQFSDVIFLNFQLLSLGKPDYIKFFHLFIQLIFTESPSMLLGSGDVEGKRANKKFLLMEVIF